MGVRIARDQEFVGDKVEDEGDEERCEDEVAWNVRTGHSRSSGRRGETYGRQTVR